MEVWSDRGSTCKFRNARSAFQNLHVDSSVASYLHEKQKSRIQSFYLYFNYMYFIKIVPFGYEKSGVFFLIQNTPSLFYGRHYSSLHRLMSLHWKLNVKIFLMFIVTENTGSVNIYNYISHCGVININVRKCMCQYKTIYRSIIDITKVKLYIWFSRNNWLLVLMAHCSLVDTGSGQL